MKYSVIWLIATTTLIVISLIVISTSAVAEEFSGQNDSENKNTKQPSNTPNRLLLLLDWSTYMRFFNKRYSSLTQQVVRHKLFLARVMEVFITGVKYKFFQLSYYTAINKWSDTTPEESKLILNGGDTSFEDDNEELQQFEDDDSAKQILLDLSLLNRQIIGNDEVGKSPNERRRKRDVSEEKSRSLSVDDLILVDQEKPKDDPGMRIKWIIDPENQNYVPPPKSPPTSTTTSDSPSSTKQSVVKDIPQEELAEINNNDRYNLSPSKVIKDAIDATINWLPSNKDHTKDKNKVTVLKDWRESGCINRPRDQGYCASCYAISSTSFVEWALCMSQGNVLTPLSVQYMVSCGLQMNEETNGQIKLMGCKHGMTRQTMDFVKEYGVELEANFPYLDQEIACPILPNTPKKYKGYIRPNVRQQLRLAGTTSQLDLALKSGPIIVSMREPKNFLAYGGGLVENCEPKGGHAMLVVGHMIEDGVEYLLIENTFGLYWGYDGYFKFKRSTEALKECVKEFIVPIVTFPGRKAQNRRIKAYLAEQQQQQQQSSDINLSQNDQDISDT